VSYRGAKVGRGQDYTTVETDFSAIGNTTNVGAFGGFGASVERTADFPAAFKEAQASGKPAIIRLAIDPEAITPATTLAKIRAKSLAEKGSG